MRRRNLTQIFCFYIKCILLISSFLQNVSAKSWEHQTLDYHSTLLHPVHSKQKKICLHKPYTIIDFNNQTNPNYLLAAIEIEAFVGFFTAGYVMDKSNLVDRDFNLHSSIKSRLNGNALRFDDNDYATNEGHVLAGAGYYSLARANGLGRLTSLLYTAMGSSSWEYLTEFREVVSINDQINTILGGFALAEPVHELIKIFQSGPDTFYNRSLKTIFEAPYRFNDWASTRFFKKPIYHFNEDPPDVWAKLDLYLNAYTLDAPQFHYLNEHALSAAVDAQIIDIPMFEKPGYVDEILTDNVFAQVTMENTINSSHLRRFRLFAKTTLGAYYQKNLNYDKEHHLQGYNFFIGPSTALDIKNENSLIIGKDFYNVVHVLGGTIDLTGYHHGIHIRGVLDAYADFSMMQAYAFNQYATTHDINYIQSVLKKWNYYYGAGYTLNAWLKVNAGPLELGVSTNNINAYMLNGRSRFSAQGIKGHCGEGCLSYINANDQRINSSIWVSYTLIKPLKIRFSIDRVNVIGEINKLGSVRAEEIRNVLSLVYSFRS